MGRVSPAEANAGDGETLPKLIAQAKNNLPPGRIRTLAYDKAADTNDVHELLTAEQIRAVIQNRSLWKSEPERMLPGHDGNSNIVYDEAGTVHCYDRVSQRRCGTRWRTSAMSRIARRSSTVARRCTRAGSAR